jgi:hypothetical protein
MLILVLTVGYTSLRDILLHAQWQSIAFAIFLQQRQSYLTPRRDQGQDHPHPFSQMLGDLNYKGVHPHNWARRFVLQFPLILALVNPME